MKIQTFSAKDTVDLGIKFSRVLKAKDVVLLEGELGGGKTTFVKGVLKGLGFKGRVLSPSFTLVRQYRAKKFTVYHADLYRLKTSRDALDIGMDECFYAPCTVTFVEWGEKIEDVLPQYLKVSFFYVSAEHRKIVISSRGYKNNRLKGL